MPALYLARAPQLAHIGKKTAKTLPQLRERIRAEGNRKHSDLRVLAQEKCDIDPELIVWLRRAYDASA